MTIRGPFAAVILLLLVVSVGANLLVAGFVLARVSGGPFVPNDVERIVAFGVRGFPPEIRDEVEERSRQQRRALRSQFDAVREARRDMYEAMRAEPFDRADLEAAFESLRVATDALQHSAHDIVVDVVEGAPPELRREIRDRRRRRGPPGPR